MAKRKKRKKRNTPQKSGGGQRKKQRDGLGALGQALREAGVERPDRVQPPEPPAEPEPEPPRQLTPEELMAEAFQNVERDAHAAKFLGEGWDAGDVEVLGEGPEPEAAARTSEVDDATEDDLLFFEAMVGTVSPIERDERALRDKEWVGAQWRDAVEVDRLSPEQLETPELTPEQREHLRRAKKERGAMPVLNIRRMRKKEAMSEVDAFVRGCHTSGTRFARIVHGKGRHSEGDPVLKPAVVAWCEGPGATIVRGWAPETDRTGRFGSVVVELTRS